MKASEMNITPDVVARFEAKTCPEALTGCTLWTGATYRTGYGKFSYSKNRLVLAHRASWRIFKGDIPDSSYCCHSCDVPACVNPDHLFLGNQTDNMRDMVSKGRERHPSGSELSFAKLTESLAREIRRRHRNGDLQKDLADEFGVSRSAISSLMRNKTWKAV